MRLTLEKQKRKSPKPLPPLIESDRPRPLPTNDYIGLEGSRADSKWIGQRLGSCGNGILVWK